MTIYWSRETKKKPTSHFYDDEVALYHPHWGEDQTDENDLAAQTDRVVVGKTNKGYFIAPARLAVIEERRGPFRYLKDAKAATETLLLLNEIPKHWSNL